MGYNNQPTYRAGGTITPSSFVIIDTGNDYQVVQSGAGGRAIGISQPGQKSVPGLAGSSTVVAAASGDSIQVYGLGEVCQLTLGSGGCTRGDWLKSDSSGNGITHPTGSPGLAYVGAFALQSGTAAALVMVQVIIAQMNPA